MRIHLNIVKKNDESMKEAMDSYLKSNRALAKRYSVNRMKKIWREAMGPTIASYTKNLFLKDKTLFIKINSSALRQDLSMSKHKIRDLFNEKMGIELIDEVVVR